MAHLIYSLKEFLCFTFAPQLLIASFIKLRPVINKPETLHTLIEKIADRTGIDKEKAIEALLTVSEHIKEEFPLLHSVVDLILGTREPSVSNQMLVVDFSKKLK